MHDCGFSAPPFDWDLVVVWSVAKLKGKSLKVCLAKLCLAACIYHLWRQRNALLHGNSPRTEEAIVGQIRWEVRSRILARNTVEIEVKDSSLIYRSNIHTLW